MEYMTVMPFLLPMLLTLLTRAQTYSTGTVGAVFGTEQCPAQSSAECSYAPGACMCVCSKNDTDGFSRAILHCTSYINGGGGNAGTIASIHSQEENDKLHDLIKDDGVDAWIGLQCPNGPLWYDGTEVTYTNWEDPANIGNIASDYKMVAASGKWKPIDDYNVNLRVTCRFKYEIPTTTEASTKEAPTTEAPHAGGPNMALIVGVSVAGVVLLVAAVVAFLVWRWIRRRRILEGYTNIAQNTTVKTIS